MAQSTAAEEQTNVRSTGKVVTFRNGYGFIKPDEGGEDLFVHYSAIKSDGGYRSLTEDEVVEFTVALANNKYQAIDVTAPGGEPIQSNTRRSEGVSDKRGGGGFGGSWNRRNNGRGSGGGAGCYNCGNPGHIARDCDNRGGNGDNNNGGCFKCGNSGHFARDCPRAANGGGSGGGGGGSNVACYSCGGYGHMARSCPGGSGACYNCGGFGHLARDCTSARGSGGGRSANSGGGGCFNCGEEGHFARDCTKS